MAADLVYNSSVYDPRYLCFNQLQGSFVEPPIPYSNNYQAPFLGRAPLPKASMWIHEPAVGSRREPAKKEASSAWIMGSSLNSGPFWTPFYKKGPYEL